jgi:multiple sugar transport system substrate-binding protein
MKRYLAFVLILALVLPLLSGCHGAKERVAFEVPAEFDTTKTHEITFWAKNDTNTVQVNTYKKAIADFEALYPNVKVTLKHYTDYGRLYQDVITNIATDTAPNVCITYPDHVATYKQGEEVVVALDELMADPKYGLGGSELLFDGPTMDQIVPKFLSECKQEGYYYAIPYMRSTEACYVNKTFVEKLGFELPEVLTWDFVFEVSRAAMEKETDGKTFKVNGQKTLIPFIYKSTDNMMIQMLNQLDVLYSTDQGEIGLFNDTTKSILYEIADLCTEKAFNTFKIVGYPANFLNAGQCIFAIDSTAGATWMGSQAPLVDIPEDKLVEFETVVMPIPQYDPQNPTMISQGPSLCVFNKEDPQEVLASWLFAQYLLTNEVQFSYATTEGYVPVTTKAQQSVEYQDYLSRAGEDNDFYYQVKMDATNLLLDNVDRTFVTPVFNGSASLRDAAGQLIESTVRTVRRKEPVDEAYMDKLYDETYTAFHLDQIQVDGEWKQDFGALPKTSVFLLTALGVTWAVLGIFAVGGVLKRRKKQ